MARDRDEGIPISKLPAGNSAPGRVVGMHGSNPAHVISIIEVIAGYVSPFITERTAAGKLGIKNGGGIFSYTPERSKELMTQRARKPVAVRKALGSS